jgi:hypothetical protein
MGAINCRWCGMGHSPKPNGEHWIVKSIIPARIDIRECAYHKAGAVSPIVQRDHGTDGLRRSEQR